jgi:hypothetical protein
MTEIHHKFLYPSIERTKEGEECPRKEDHPHGRAMENHLSTTSQKVICVQDLNRDEVGIPILIEISHNNDTMVCHGINGLGK